MLEIRNLYASVDGNEILKGINLTVNKGEVHAIMGPNGSGKSTLAKVLSGHPQYEVTRGEVIYQGKNLLEMTPDERAREGVFMAFQYPIEVPGVSNSQFLRLAYNEKQKHLGAEELDPLEFKDYLKEQAKLVEMDASFMTRSVNEGFPVAKRSVTRSCNWRCSIRNSRFWMRPIPVSSKTESFGSSTAICRISLRFFSPPEILRLLNGS